MNSIDKIRTIESFHRAQSLFSCSVYDEIVYEGDRVDSSIDEAEPES